MKQYFTTSRGELFVVLCESIVRRTASLYILYL